MIIDEAWRTGSFAAAVSAQIMERGFDLLDSPVARVCSAEVPMPYAKHMEDAALPQPAAIVAASPDSWGMGTLAVLNYDIHSARFVQKSHTAPVVLVGRHQLHLAPLRIPTLEHPHRPNKSIGVRGAQASFASVYLDARDLRTPDIE